MPATKSRLVIGLDFGTTYTGVAYCDEVGARQGLGGIQLMQSWPGISRMGNKEKTPSRIAYVGQGADKQVLWGDLIKPSVRDVHACMKLRLDEKQPASRSQPLRTLVSMLAGVSVNDVSNQGGDEQDGDNSSSGSIGPGGKDAAVELVADYLAEVREPVWKELRRRYPAALDTIQKELVVTVPAVWSERAKDLTLKAVSRAGWDADVISLVTEPEAAAVYTLKWMTEGANRDEVEVGDVFVLCDAGGGTVDLISYEVTQVHPTFQMEEAAVGSGDKCGATFIDKEFLTWLEKWIGPDNYKKIKPEKLRHGSQLMNMFELSKNSFGGDDDNMEMTLPECGITTDETLNIEDHVLSLKTDQMRAIFGPSVDRTLQLIDGQVEAAVKTRLAKPKMVLLVGGFGRNQYLYRRIEEHCGRQGIQTLQPSDPWSAVARGAVRRGLEGRSGGAVRVRLARSHYGMPMDPPWNPKIHHPDDFYVDKITGDKRARGQITWLWGKGDRLPADKPKTISIGACCTFAVGDGIPGCGARLVSSDNKNAPTRNADDAVKRVCTVVADLRNIPVSCFLKKRSSITGKEYYQANVELEATFENTLITWRALFDGKECGSTTCSFED